MWVESKVEQGSTFYFTVVAVSDPNSLPADGEHQLTQLDGKRLLIVDDHPTNRQILTLQAQSWGMLTRAAASGGEACEWLSQGEAFDIAILDMQMPQMDGLTLASKIQQQPNYQDLPLVMLTSLGSTEINDRDRDVKFAAFLTKPIKQSHLYNVLLNILGNQPPLDVSVLRSFREMMGEKADEILAEMIDCYLEDAPKLMDAIALAVAQKDALQLRYASHTLKSSSLTLGATTLSQLCQELEAMSRAGHTEGGLDKMPGLEAEYERVKVALGKIQY